MIKMFHTEYIDWFSSLNAMYQVFLTELFEKLLFIIQVKFSKKSKRFLYKLSTLNIEKNVFFFAKMMC